VDAIHIEERAIDSELKKCQNLTVSSTISVAYQFPKFLLFSFVVFQITYSSF